MGIDVRVAVTSGNIGHEMRKSEVNSTDSLREEVRVHFTTNVNAYLKTYLLFNG